MTIIIGILLIFCNIYILGVYCHPEDAGFGANAYCKLIVVKNIQLFFHIQTMLLKPNIICQKIVGLTLSWGQVLMVPLDVSNSRGYGSGFDMMSVKKYYINNNIAKVWYGVYITVLIFISFIIPTAQFYYESDEDKTFFERICTTIIMEFVMLLFMGVFLAIFYLFCSKAEVPILVLFFKNEITNNVLDDYFSTVVQSSTTSKLTFTVSLYISIMAFLSFVGYFFLILFGGMGLSALPIDLLRSFQSRPTYKSSKQAFSKKSELRDYTQKLINLAEKIHEDQLDMKHQKGFWARRKKRNQYSADFQIFSEAVLQLEDEYQLFKMELNISETNPIVFYAKLLLGFIGIIISLVWITHIFLAVIIKKNGFPVYPLLDKMFLKLESIGVSFVGVALFAMFTLYLLWCTMKGNFKIGIAIPFLFTIHPMRPNETWMNSFLFNLNLILITTVALVQFVSKCFSQYMRFSELDTIYGRQTWSFLSAVYFIYKSQTKPQLIKDIEEQKKKMKKYKGNNEVELQELFIKKGAGRLDNEDDNKSQKSKKNDKNDKKKNDKEKSSEKDKDKDKDKGKKKDKGNVEVSVYELQDIENNKKSKKNDSKKKK